jgi:hypothetical protein
MGTFVVDGDVTVFIDRTGQMYAAPTLFSEAPGGPKNFLSSCYLKTIRFWRRCLAIPRYAPSYSHGQVPIFASGWHGSTGHECSQKTSRLPWRDRFFNSSADMAARRKPLKDGTLRSQSLKKPRRSGVFCLTCRMCSSRIFGCRGSRASLRRCIRHIYVILKASLIFKPLLHDFQNQQACRTGRT